MITVRYEHRLIEETNLGDWYGKDLILPAGYIIHKSKNANKLRFYGLTMAHGAGLDVPTEKVGVFKITRTVTETEEFAGQEQKTQITFSGPFFELGK